MIFISSIKPGERNTKLKYKNGQVNVE